MSKRRLESLSSHSGQAYTFEAMGRLAPIIFVLIASAVLAQDKQPTLKETLDWMLTTTLYGVSGCLLRALWGKLRQPSL